MIRLAYLNTKYPSLSHTFIEREVRAVRAAGIEVHTFSIRPPSANDRLSEQNERAARETCYLLKQPLFRVIGCFRQALQNPRSCLRVLIAGQRLSPPGLGFRLRHFSYSLEAMVLSGEMQRRKLKHVHVHMANNGAAVALLATVYDRSLTYSLSIHGSAEFFHIDTWRLKDKAEGATFVRCISKFCRAQVMAWSDATVWNRFHIVHCGVDPAEYTPGPASGPASALRLLTVGRLEPIKGYPLLLTACRQLTDHGIEWRLDMVGEGRLRPFLEQRARELGIADKITFSGAVGQDDVQKHFENADVMVVSSCMEGVPVVLMEAMAKQMAVVAPRVGGIPELITDGVNGLLVAPGSPEDLTDALQRLAKDRELLSSLGPPARRRIEEEFSISLTGRQMVDLFENFIDTRVPRTSRASLSHLVPPEAITSAY